MPGFNDFLARALKYTERTAGVPDLLYMRGSQRVSFTATIGSTQFRVDPLGEADAAFQVQESRDYHIDAAVFLAFNPSEPRRGDIIAEPSGDQYEVTPFNGEPCYGAMDPNRSRFRVHTQMIARETEADAEPE